MNYIFFASIEYRHIGRIMSRTSLIFRLYPEGKVMNTLRENLTHPAVIQLLTN